MLSLCLSRESPEGQAFGLSFQLTRFPAGSVVVSFPAIIEVASPSVSTLAFLYILLNRTQT